jgi:hypothetical protein
VVRLLLAGGPLGDHRADPLPCPQGGQGLLTAHGLTEYGDLSGTGAGMPAQERHRGGDVPAAPPAKVHRMAA